MNLKSEKNLFLNFSEKPFSENCVGLLKQTEGRNLKTKWREEGSHHYEQTMTWFS